jgi:methionyl aminopeptidase
MKELKEKVRPGITTKELDKAAQGLVLKYKVEPAFKGYKGFPAILCTSINEEIVHALPSDRVLKEGDIISLDLGIKWCSSDPAIKYSLLKQDQVLVHGPETEIKKRGREKEKCFYLDMAITLPVGKISYEAQRLIRVTKKALKLAIKKAKSGNTTGDIGNTIERYVKSQGFSVIKELAGHGIGKELHEDPQIFNFGKRKKGEKLKEGMTICLEPMVSQGRGEVEKSKDGFGFITKDKSLASHFEHTIAITKKGALVLTSF